MAAAASASWTSPSTVTRWSAGAAIGSSVAMDVVVQDQLLKQVDDTLSKTALVGGPGRGGPFGDRGPQLVTGRQDVFGQIVDANGTIVQADLGVAVPALVTQDVK